MRVIAVIEEQEVIHKILTHLGVWQIKARPRPVADAPAKLAATPQSGFLSLHTSHLGETNA